MIVRHEGPPRYLIGFDVELLTRCGSDADAIIHLPFAVGDPVTVQVDKVDAPRGRTDLAPVVMA